MWMTILYIALGFFFVLVVIPLLLNPGAFAKSFRESYESTRDRLKRRG